ncbi:MAG: hypothetical protein IT366_10240 [Candidatus Hydrogenedentes bacterium]|nr:hypothetical protein [Candidatus Hydrogenedentota bacterium]
MSWVRNTPLFVWFVGAFFALMQPLVHALVLYGASGDVVPTGLHKPDSAIYLHAMRMFETGFHSPYATCQSPIGDHSVRFFLHPTYVVYGAAGELASSLRVSEFVMLGIVNGLAGLCYLLAVYHLLRAVAPRYAMPAFLLFTCSGGLGGVVYAIAAVSGVTDSVSFSQWFYRFAIYDLVEGTNLSPQLLMTRMYYTMPLALGFAGFTTCLTAWRNPCNTHLRFGQAMLFLCALFNARLGPPLGTIALLYLFRDAQVLRKLIALAVPLVLGVLCATLVMMRHVSVFGNTLSVVRQEAWLTSYISAGFPLLLIAVPTVVRNLRGLNGPFRIVAFGCTGYLLTYVALFFLYQAYYGTLLVGADHAAALRVSDFALMGFLCGAVWSFTGAARGEQQELDWVIVWFLVFTAIAVSAFGQGWFLRFSPQRMLVFLGIPLALLAAQSLEHARAQWPMAARAAIAVVAVCGVSSLLVSNLVFQGPLGMRPGLASDIGMHAAYLNKDDAECLTTLQSGTIAAPAPYNDILSLRDGVTVLGGYGGLALSDQGANIREEVNTFFSTEASAAYRAEFLQRWCVAHVFLPSDARNRNALESAFASMPELTQTNTHGDARLYSVTARN